MAAGCPPPKNKTYRAAHENLRGGSMSETEKVKSEEKKDEIDRALT